MRVEIIRRVDAWSYPLIAGDRLDVSKEIGFKWCSEGLAVQISNEPNALLRRASDHQPDLHLLNG